MKKRDSYAVFWMSIISWFKLCSSVYQIRSYKEIRVISASGFKGTAFFFFLVNKKRTNGKPLIYATMKVNKSVYVSSHLIPARITFCK